MTTRAPIDHGDGDNNDDEDDDLTGVVGASSGRDPMGSDHDPVNGPNETSADND